MNCQAIFFNITEKHKKGRKSENTDSYGQFSSV